MHRTNRNSRQRTYVSVIGAGRCDTELYERAREVGRRLAGIGAVIICGGLGGVMEAAARGAREGGGTSVGILPSHDRRTANPYVDLAITTGIGEARNLTVVSSGDVVVAIGGEYGTLSEIGLAAKIGRPVILFDGWWQHGWPPNRGGIHFADSVDEVLDLVLSLLPADS